MPVVGSVTISFSMAAAGSSSAAGLAHRPVAATPRPTSTARIYLYEGTDIIDIVTYKVTISRALLRAKLDESLPPPHLTRRDVRLPTISGKGFSVIGMRRSGKTSFLAEHRASRLPGCDALARHARLLPAAAPAG